MKCNKVKHPCKICFQPVSNKNGLQCQGACRKWAHFKCLNYTPGKIQDIKAGVIKITCPCPDCNAGVPKEILTNPPYTCTNTQCPANKIPAVYSSVDFPSNDLCPQSCVPQKIIGAPKSPSPPLKKSSGSPLESPCPPPRSPGPPPRSPGPPPRSPGPPSKSPVPPPKSPFPPSKYSPSTTPNHPPSKRPKSPPPFVPTKKSSSSNRPVCSSCPSSQRVRNSKKSCSPKQSQSCSNMSKASSSSVSGKQIDKMRPIYSDSKLPTGVVDPKMLFAAIESLCSTVGELSSQLRNLMCEIQIGYGL